MTSNPYTCDGCRHAPSRPDSACTACRRENPSDTKIFRARDDLHETTDGERPVKYTRFRDVPQFTRAAGWRCNYGLAFLVKQFHEWMTEENTGLPKLQLNPDFQRGHVWTPAQQVAYLEFLFRGGTSGLDLYLNCPSWHGRVAPGEYDEFVVVDGLQRFTAIESFLAGEIPVFGSFVDEFRDEPSLVRNTMLVHVNDLRSRAEVLTWYLEMNAGGTPHSSDEIARVETMLAAERATRGGGTP